MKDEQLADLKQFIDSRISRSESRFDTKLQELREEMRDGFAGVVEAIDQILAVTDSTKNLRLSLNSGQPEHL